jgi:uncharacterized protein YkwD
MRHLIILLFLTLISCEEKVSQEAVAPVEKNTNAEKALVLVNKIRSQNQKCGGSVFEAVGPIKLNEKLSLAALNHAKDMSDKNYFAHTSPDGKTILDRILLVKYAPSYWAENIYVGYGYQPDVEEAVAAWLKSPGHCQTLMNPTFKEMGLSAYNSYWVQVFGTQN